MEIFNDERENCEKAFYNQQRDKDYRDVVSGNENFSCGRTVV